MAEALRLLLVEDNPMDEQLIRKLLTKAVTPKPSITSCTSLDSGLAYLATSSFDAVLLNLSLPDRFGLDAVDAVVKHYPEIPIVALTDSADAKLSEHAIDHGAEDCIAKRTLSAELLSRMLAHAIDRHAIEISIKQSEQRFRALFTASPIPTAIADPKGRGLTAANPAFLETIGYSEEDLPELSLARITHPDDFAEDMATIERVLADTEAEFLQDKRVIRKDGTVIRARVMGTILRGATGEPDQILVVLQDITEAKEASMALEAEQERLASMMEALPAFLYLQASDYSITFANRRFRELFGDPEGRKCHEIFRSAIKPCSPCKTLSTLETRKEIVREWTDSKGRTFEIRERPYLSQTGEELVLVIGTEITDLIQATQALRLSEQRFRELAEMLPEVVFECDREGKLTFANQVAFDRFGYTEAQFDQGLNALEMIAEDERPSALESIGKVLASGVQHGTQYTALRADGTTFAAIIHATPIIREETAVGLRGILVDISEQTEARRAIQEKETRLRLLFESAPIGIGYHAPDGTTLALNATAVKRLSGSREDYLGKKLSDYSKDPAQVRRRFERALESETGNTYEDRVERSSGIRWYQRTYTALRDASGEPIGVQVISNNITAIKEAQEALEMAEHIVRSTPVGMFIYRHHVPNRLVLIDANPEAERLTGIKLDEWRGREFNEIWPAARDIGLTRAFLQAFDSSTLFSTDDLPYTDRHTTGRYRIRAFRIPGDRLVVSFEDVLDLKEAERALRDSELRYRSLFENAALGIYQTTPDGRILTANPALVHLLGYDSLEELAKRNLEEEGYDPESSRARFKEIIEASGIVRGLESSWQRKDGSSIRIRENARVVRDSQGEILYYEGTLEDITERTEAARQLAESERRYRAIVETSPMGILTINLAGIITSCNHAFVQMTGYESSAFIGKHFSKLPPVRARDLPKYVKAFSLIASGKTPEPFETSWETQSGTVRHGEIRVRVMKQDGKTWNIQVIVQDITERRAAEEQLRESEAMQRGILEASPIGIGLIRGQKIQWVSDRICEMSGYSTEELVGQSPLLTAPNDEEYRRIQQAMESRLRKRGVAHVETQWLRKDGTTFDVDLRFASLDRADLSKGEIFTLLDITEQRQMARSLELTQFSMDTADVIILWLQPDGKVVFVNEAACRILGYEREDLLGKFVWEISPNYPREQRAFLWEALQTGGTETGETELICENGARLPVELTAQYLAFQGVEYEFVFALDIQERKAAEAALHESEASYRTIFDSANDAIMLHNAETGHLLEVNQKTEEMFGYTPREFLKLAVEDFSAGIAPYVQEEALRLIQAAAAGIPQLFEWHARKKDGELFWVEVSLRQASLRGMSVVLAIVRDVSQRKQLEAQLRQRQKLESIGTLASGVAHEINNPLMGMINYAELISGRVENEKLKEFAEGIKTEGDRVARIVRNLLSFSRQDQEEHSRARLVDIIDAALSLIGSLLRKDFIELDVDVPEDLPQIRCRSQQIQQVIINLVTNARDSLNEKYSMADENKVVRIRSYVLQDPEGLWLRTMIQDTGVGIAENVRTRIFDPFFTTKSRDKGTGLGLSISYGIVKEHNGRLSVQSEPDVRTCFFVDLPVSTDEE